MRMEEEEEEEFITSGNWVARTKDAEFPLHAARKGPFEIAEELLSRP